MNTDKIFAEQLANEYSTKDTTKVVALRKLDNRAKLPAYIFVYTFGIISALVMGWGMCLSMGIIGVATMTMFTAGIVIGIVGLIGLAVSSPIFKPILANGKRKYAFEIMQLAQQISEE